MRIACLAESQAEAEATSGRAEARVLAAPRFATPSSKSSGRATPLATAAAAGPGVAAEPWPESGASHVGGGRRADRPTACSRGGAAPLPPPLAASVGRYAAAAVPAAAAVSGVVEAVGAVVGDMLGLRYGLALDGVDFARRAREHSRAATGAGSSVGAVGAAGAADPAGSAGAVAQDASSVALAPAPGFACFLSVPLDFVARLNAQPDLRFRALGDAGLQMRLRVRARVVSSFQELCGEVRRTPGTARAVAILAAEAPEADGSAGVGLGPGACRAVAVYREDYAQPGLLVGRAGGAGGGAASLGAALGASQGASQGAAEVALVPFGEASFRAAVLLDPCVVAVYTCRSGHASGVGLATSLEPPPCRDEYTAALALGGRGEAVAWLFGDEAAAQPAPVLDGSEMQARSRAMATAAHEEQTWKAALFTLPRSNAASGNSGSGSSSGSPLPRRGLAGALLERRAAAKAQSQPTALSAAVDWLLSAASAGSSGGGRRAAVVSSTHGAAAGPWAVPAPVPAMDFRSPAPQGAAGLPLQGFTLAAAVASVVAHRQGTTPRKSSASPRAPQTPPAARLRRGEGW